MAATPNVLNYYIGKGVVSFKKDGDMDYRDLGNVPEFEFTPSIEKLDHHSSRGGVKTKDRTVALEKNATIRIVMDEMVAENLALAAMGEVEDNTAGDPVIDIFSLTEIRGALKFIGTNEIGAQVDILLYTVSFTPSSSINPISDEWGQIEITGDVLNTGSGFGTMTVRAENSSA